MTTMVARFRCLRQGCALADRRHREPEGPSWPLTSRPVSLTSVGLYQRETVYTPSGVSASRKCFHPRFVKPILGERENVAPVAAQVSIRLIWYEIETAHWCAANQLRASSTIEMGSRNVARDGLKSRKSLGQPIDEDRGLPRHR